MEVATDEDNGDPAEVLRTPAEFAKLFTAYNVRAPSMLTSSMITVPDVAVTSGRCVILLLANSSARASMIRDFPVPPSASDELAELESPSLVTTYSVDLAAYQLEGDALSSIEREQLGQLSPCLRKRCGRAKLDAQRWACAPDQSLGVYCRDMDILLRETVQHTVYSCAMAVCAVVGLAQYPLDHLLPPGKRSSAATTTEPT
ncbi:hypothetical protein DL767_004282 [Monosporascus sp. MG133]|nr:hypothetical protein DL767_004282 [Monosporascus sp. MG133]